jgi:hypothetical protein
MKALLFLLLLPLFSQSQTIHRKGKKIVYEGEVTLPGRTSAEVLAQLQSVAGTLVKNGKNPAAFHANGQTLEALGNMQLNTEYHLIRNLNYTLQLTAKENGYAYRIDSVYVTERKRDGDEKTRTGKQLLKDMEVSGPVAEATEKILNEIDMNFQKLLTVMKAKMEKENSATH